MPKKTLELSIEYEPLILDMIAVFRDTLLLALSEAGQRFRGGGENPETKKEIQAVLDQVADLDQAISIARSARARAESKARDSAKGIISLLCSWDYRLLVPVEEAEEKALEIGALGGIGDGAIIARAKVAGIIPMEEPQKKRPPSDG